MRAKQEGSFNLEVVELLLLVHSSRVDPAHTASFIQSLTRRHHHHKPKGGLGQKFIPLVEILVGRGQVVPLQGSRACFAVC